MSKIAGFVVVGRPPGLITYERRMRQSMKHSRNAGKTQVVKRKRRVIAAHEHAYAVRSTAEDLKRRIEATGWTDVAILQDGTRNDCVTQG